MYVVNVLLFYGIFSKYGTYSKVETVHAMERSRSGRIGDAHATNLLFVSQPLLELSYIIIDRLGSTGSELCLHSAPADHALSMFLIM